MRCFLLIVLFDSEENTIINTHRVLDILLLATFIFCVVEFKKMIFTVKMERVKMPLESQVEKSLLICSFWSAGILPALDLVLQGCLRTSDRSWNMEVQLMN